MLWTLVIILLHTQKPVILQRFCHGIMEFDFCNVVIPTNMMDCILGTMIVFSGGKASPDELIPAPRWVLCINHEVSIILMQMCRSPIRQRAQSPGNNVMGYWAFEIYSLAKFSKAKQI